MPAPLPIRTDRDAAELRRLARREHDGRVGARLLALANALDGLPRERAAELAGMTGQTLGDWVHRYNAEGVAGLRDRPRPGRPCALDEGRQAALQPRTPEDQGSAAGARRLRRLARPGPVRPRRAPLRRPLRRERDGAADEASRLVPAEGPAGPPRGRPESAGALQKPCPG